MRRTQFRLLVLLPFPPRLDASHGGGRATAQLLALLANRHRVALIYLRAPADSPLDPVLQERCDAVEEIIRPDRGASLASAHARIGSLLRGWPLWVAGCSVAEFGSRLRLLARTWCPDIVQVEYHVMGQYLSSLNGCLSPRLLVPREPGASAARDRWQSSRGGARVVRYFDMLAWERFERSIVNQVQAIVVFTERDRRALQAIAEPPPLVCIPSGVILPQKALNPTGEEPVNLLFVGNFIHPPNVDAAMRLIECIFPLVLMRVPNAILRLVGDKPSDRLRKMANENIVITGHVPDVMPYLDRATVVVVPLRTGGGMRVKVLEALAAGKAIVASRLAVEGLDVLDGQQVLLAETDEQFANAIIHLVTQAERRTSLAVSARIWACAHLDWHNSVTAYEALYERLLQSSASFLGSTR